jgi:hypothetical protein
LISQACTACHTRHARDPPLRVLRRRPRPPLSALQQTRLRRKVDGSWIDRRGKILHFESSNLTRASPGRRWRCPAGSCEECENSFRYSRMIGLWRIGRTEGRGRQQQFLHRRQPIRFTARNPPRPSGPKKTDSIPAVPARGVKIPGCHDRKRDKKRSFNPLLSRCLRQRRWHNLGYLQLPMVPDTWWTRSRGQTSCDSTPLLSCRS